MATPYFKSENCFRRYEKVIAQLTERFPREVRFRSKRKPVTDAARLRDAINSFRDRNWHTELIDRTRFMDTVYGHYAVEVVDDYVVVGPKRPPTAEVVDVATVKQAVAGSVEFPSKEQISAAINAIEHGVVEMPIEFTKVNEEMQTYLKEQVSHCFNVAFNQVNDTITLV